MSPAEKIITKFGGIKPMARLLGHRWPSRVQGWKEAGVIPARAQQDVLEAARANGIELSPADFFDAPATPAAPTKEPDLDPAITRPTALDSVIAHLVRDKLLPPSAETKSPRTFCKEPGKKWRRLPDTEAPPMDARIIRTEWNGTEWVQTFDSHEPVEDEAA